MSQPSGKAKTRGARKLKEAMAILHAVGFGPKQSNEEAGYVLLALLGLGPDDGWDTAAEPLLGITPIIDFVALKKNAGGRTQGVSPRQRTKEIEAQFLTLDKSKNDFCQESRNGPRNSPWVKAVKGSQGLLP